jgi:signal transduction histidine kinase
VQHAQENERKRISRELHDDLCQRLSGMKFRVEALEGETGPEQKWMGKQLRDFRHELDRAISEVRRISSNLRPSVLDDFGLVTALRLLCKDFERLHGVKTTLRLGSDESLQLDPNTEIALYRITQEALANVAKHAGASQLTLHLIRRPALVELLIQDNGHGFPQEIAEGAKGGGHGLGLMNMRERAELLGGTFEVDSEAEKGTCVSVTLPMGDLAVHEQDQNPDR